MDIYWQDIMSRYYFLLDFGVMKNKIDFGFNSVISITLKNDLKFSESSEWI